MIDDVSGEDCDGFLRDWNSNAHMGVREPLM